MARKSDIVIIDGQEFVETEDARFGLGLNVPDVRVEAFPRLTDKGISLLDMAEARSIIERDDFLHDGRHFDSSWVTNQNGYGSCAGYGGASALAKARVLAGQPRVDLSGDYLYSLVNDGRDNGTGLNKCMTAIVSKGVATAATVPLGGIYPRKYDKAKADAEANRFRGHELFAVPDEQTLVTALTMGIPVVIAIHVTRRWRDFDADDVLAECNGVGNHCEHVDGIRYSRKNNRFEFRKGTSHGASYSDDGYCWTYWDGHYRQTSRNHVFYGVPAAIQDPQGDIPPVPGGDDVQPVPVDAPEIVVYSRAGCIWCDKWKREEKPKAISVGWKVTEETAGGSVPRFTVRKDGREAERTGFMVFQSLVNLV